MKKRCGVVAAIIIALGCSAGATTEAQMNRAPLRVSPVSDHLGMVNQLNRLFKRLETRLDAMEKKSAAGAEPSATSAAVSALKAEIAGIKSQIAPPVVTGARMEGGSVLTQHLGIGAATGSGAWAANTAIAAGQIIRPTGSPANGNYFFKSTGSGTTGATEPLWNTEDGGTTDDNNLVWIQGGLASAQPTGSSSYATVNLSAVSLPNATWTQLAYPELYMGDVNGPILVGVNLYDTTFTAGDHFDIDLQFAIPVSSGYAYFETAKHVSAANLENGAVGGMMTFTTISQAVPPGFTPVTGTAAVRISVHQGTGSAQTINYGTIYVAALHE